MTGCTCVTCVATAVVRTAAWLWARSRWLPTDLDVDETAAVKEKSRSAQEIRVFILGVLLIVWRPNAILWREQTRTWSSWSHQGNSCARQSSNLGFCWGLQRAVQPWIQISFLAVGHCCPLLAHCCICTHSPSRSILRKSRENKTTYSSLFFDTLWRKKS